MVVVVKGKGRVSLWPGRGLGSRLSKETLAPSAWEFPKSSRWKTQIVRVPTEAKLCSQNFPQSFAELGKFFKKIPRFLFLKSEGEGASPLHPAFVMPQKPSVLLFPIQYRVCVWERHSHAPGA